MSGVINSITSINVSESEINLNDECSSYRKEIAGKVVQFVGLFYLVYGIFVAFIWTSLGLDSYSIKSDVRNYFYDPVITCNSLANIAVFVMIVLNKDWINKSLVRRTVQKPNNLSILGIIVIPLYISSVIFNVVEVLRDLSIIPCHGHMSFMAPLSAVALTTGATILIFDIDYFNARFTDWVKEMVQSHLTFFTLIGITNCLLVSVAVQHMKLFRTQSQNSSYKDLFKLNNSCIEQKMIGNSLTTVFEYCDTYLKPTYILFCICTLAILSQTEEPDTLFVREEATPQLPVVSLRGSDQLLFQENLETEMETSLKDSNVEKKVSYRLPSASLIICITSLSLCLLSYVITFSLSQSKVHSYFQHLGSLIFCIFISIVYVTGAGLSVVHINEIRRWPLSKNRKDNIIDKCLIWVGAGGQLSLSLAFISSAVVGLGEKQGAFIAALCCMIIFTNILMMIQTFLQTIQASLLLDRNWLRPNINSFVESLCPAVGLMGLNLGLLLLSLYQLKNSILNIDTQIFSIQLFTNEICCVGETLAILQRLHASLLFASMIVYTHN